MEQRYGKISHSLAEHKCGICFNYGHLEKDCSERCVCGKEHYLEEHKCEICFKHGHLEKDCSEKCVCGEEHYLAEHYCELSQEIHSGKRKAEDIDREWIKKRRTM